MSGYTDIKTLSGFIYLRGPLFSSPLGNGLWALASRWSHAERGPLIPHTNNVIVLLQFMVTSFSLIGSEIPLEPPIRMWQNVREFR